MNSLRDIEPGGNTIADNIPRKNSDGKFWLDWRYRPKDGSPSKRYRSKGATKALARSRAYAKLDKLQEAENAKSGWTVSDPLKDYAKASYESYKASKRLSPLTIRAYDEAFSLLTEPCSKHAHSLGDLRIKDVRFSSVKSILTDLASHHGRTRAKHARTVISAAIIDYLVDDDLLSGNPITGASLDRLTASTKPERTRGGVALTHDEAERVITYLLALEPLKEITSARGRWTVEDRARKLQCAIDQALLQAGTSLRANEANNVLVSDVKDVGGQMVIDVRPEVAKVGKARFALVFDDRIADRIRERMQGREAHHFVIGSPMNPAQPWDRNNASKAMRELYPRIAKECEVPALEIQRSHVWRTTNFHLWGRYMTPELANIQFGNSEAVRASNYTDPRDLDALVTAKEKYADKYADKSNTQQQSSTPIASDSEGIAA
ncbi:hypothetical protein M3D48_02960 [Dermabacter vaginalis]|uniref:hypothetical protein n=1 Tax=Dermabacter vaginalis TaxID=1630135 RepID=UPI0021A90AE6|nr:hypothetical protein [Dermabacter vaginalis]MCT2149586.1 hypothetical protein [Dermabacter vaginalis]